MIRKTNIQTVGIVLTFITSILLNQEHVYAGQRPKLVVEKNSPIISSRVWQALETTETRKVNVWIFFTDKNIFSSSDYTSTCDRIKAELPERVKWRRRKTMGSSFAAFKDIPVPESYIDQLTDLGAEIRTTSRWLNAASAGLSHSAIGAIASLPFVRKITIVNQFRRTPVKEEFKLSKLSPAQPHNLEYGASYAQLHQMNVPAVHDLGYSGAGVIVGMLDTGFNRSHEALINLDLIAEWDFINNDGNTRNEIGDSQSQHNHGTWTLSALGGASPGHLYGPGYGASFLLAKTEFLPTETPIEEDYWVAGIEWAETNGADVISSSLGYLDWYTYEDMDGSTAVTTIAADIAAQRGVVVCTAAGNERNSSWHYIIAPADADSVITCGAVYSSGEITGFSSAGPTFDGRIKPEVVARGSGTACASANDSTGYTPKSGTSLSTPLIAGSAALILEAHPQWTPMMVREALMMTADRADNPDNLYGWGIIDVLAAIQYRPKGDVNGDDVVNIHDIVLCINIINGNHSPTEPESFAADANGDDQIDLTDITTIVSMIIE